MSAGEFVATTGTVNFADGETSKTFTVDVKGDALGEYDETFAVSLGNPSFGSTASASTATGTVRNDDTVLLISADQASVVEGAGGAETTFTFTVTRSGDLSSASSALWQVVSSGATPANAADFGGVFPSGAVAFQAGESTQQISVTVLGDVVGEYEETFSVVLSDPDNRDPYYRLHIKPNQLYFERGDTRYRLVPGVRVSAAVLIGHQSVFDYLSAPLRASARGALSEP